MRSFPFKWAEDDAEKIPQTQGTGETEVAEQEELRGTVATSSIEDVEDIYVDDDDLNESNPNMMLTRRASVTDDEDGIGEMIGFPRVPVLPDHGMLIFSWLHSESLIQKNICALDFF